MSLLLNEVRHDKSVLQELPRLPLEGGTGSLPHSPVKAREGRLLDCRHRLYSDQAAY